MKRDMIVNRSDWITWRWLFAGLDVRICHGRDRGVHAAHRRSCPSLESTHRWSAPQRNLPVGTTRLKDASKSRNELLDPVSSFMMFTKSFEYLLIHSDCNFIEFSEIFIVDISVKSGIICWFSSFFIARSPPNTYSRMVPAFRNACTPSSSPCSIQKRSLSRSCARRSWRRWWRLSSRNSTWTKKPSFTSTHAELSWLEALKETPAWQAARSLLTPTEDGERTAVGHSLARTSLRSTDRLLMHLAGSQNPLSSLESASAAWFKSATQLVSPNPFRSPSSTMAHQNWSSTNSWPSSKTTLISDLERLSSEIWMIRQRVNKLLKFALISGTWICAHRSINRPAHTDTSAARASHGRSQRPCCWNDYTKLIMHPLQRSQPALKNLN